MARQPKSLKLANNRFVVTFRLANGNAFVCECWSRNIRSVRAEAARYAKARGVTVTHARLRTPADKGAKRPQVILTPA